MCEYCLFLRNVFLPKTNNIILFSTVRRRVPSWLYGAFSRSSFKTTIYIVCFARVIWPPTVCRFKRVLSRSTGVKGSVSKIEIVRSYFFFPVRLSIRERNGIRHRPLFYHRPTKKSYFPYIVYAYVQVVKIRCLNWKKERPGWIV